jgi:hypothetical protein
MRVILNNIKMGKTHFLGLWIRNQIQGIWVRNIAIRHKIIVLVDMVTK